MLAMAISSVCLADGNAVKIHGTVSVTGSYCDSYDYLGETRDQAKLNVVDAVLNGTYRFENGVRAGAQLYAYKIGGYQDLTLDWANVDYSFNETFGVRLGRNKIPLGLYNDSQDLDAVRTFASLPLSFYPKTYRAITSSCDGLNLYGNIDLGKGGSLDYQVYGGWKEDIDGDSPFVKARNNLVQYNNWHVQTGLFGGSLFWNTPLEGLRVGYSYFVTPKNELPGVLSKKAEMYGEFAALPALVDSLMGSGVWDNSGYFAGTPLTSHARVLFHVISAEYTHDKWLLAAEYKRQENTGTIDAPAFARLGRPTSSAFQTHYEWYYGMVTYQVTKKLRAGLYYSYENLARKDSAASSNPINYTKDWSAAVSYAVTDAWIVKAEGHLMNGRSQTLTSGDDNLSFPTHNNWTYLILKATFTF